MEPVFVETVVNEITILAVPLSPIIESEKFDELELSSHIVSHSCSFSALLSFDTHSHTGFLYHVYVVGTVSHCHGQVISLLFHPPHDFLLVFGSATIADGRVERNFWWNGLFGIEQKHFLFLVFLQDEHIHSPLPVFVRRVVRDIDDLHLRIDKATRSANRNCSFLLVARQNEEIHP